MFVQSDPFRDLDNLMSRLVSRASTSAFGSMDAYHRGHDLWLHIDLPGVAADSVDISVERGVLTVAGERQPHRQEGDRTFATERFSGPFRRQVQLGESLDLDNIDADFHDGVLTLRVPIAEKAQPRKIVVSQRPIIEASEAQTGTA